MNKLFKGEIKDIYDTYDNEKLTTLITLEKVIQEKLNKVVKLSEEIQEEIIDDAEFQSDLEKAMETEVSFRKDLTVLNNFITEKQFGIKVTKSLSVPVNNSESLVKLPKFEVKKFDGDATEWQSFIESFNAAIDKNSSLSDIQKMNYLLSFVIDEAAATVKGLQLSNANYPIAMKLLTTVW